MTHDIPVKVYIRVRPLSSKEKEHGCAECVQCLEETSQLIIAEKMFTFDGVFSPSTTQDNVYEVTAGSLVEHLFNGFNCTILAYGQTGSGKTYTMGTEATANSQQDENQGITTRIISDIFKTITDSHSEVTVFVSMLEIYNENVWDLLAKGERSEPLQIRENPRGGVIVPNLSKFHAKNFRETMDFLILGCRQRSKGGTAMNAQSSRSHAVFTITLNKSAIDDETSSFESKLHLVDLAGSERLKKTLAEGDRKKEGIQINQGLLALGNVISALTEPGVIKHVPYRDSKITRLLQDGLGGNSYTVFIACVSPADSNAEESLSTLRYAERARSIKNKPILNVDPSSAQIQKLKEELKRLRERLAEAKSSSEEPTYNARKLDNENKELREKCIMYEEKLLELLSNSSLMHSKFLKLEEERDRYRKFYDDMHNLMQFENLDANLPIICELRRILEAVPVVEPTQEDETDGEAKDEFETEKSMNDTYENHIENQANLQEEFEKLSKAIQERERLISKNSENEHEIEKSIRKNQEYVEKLESQIARIKAERDDLAASLKKVTISNKLSEERRKRLQELEKQLAKYERAQTDLNKMRKLKAETDKEKKRLQEQVQDLKVARVKMAKQLKEESLKFREFVNNHNRELNKLRNNERKREFQVAKEKADMARQMEFYRRRYEEATKSRKRLQSRVENHQRDPVIRQVSTMDFKNFLDKELDIISSRHDATLSRNSLIEQRKEMKAKVTLLKTKLKDADKTNISKKRKSENNENIVSDLKKEIQNLENEIELLTTEINEIQAKCAAIDENAGIDQQVTAIRTIPQAHSAIRILFDKLVEKIKLQLDAEKTLIDLKQLYADGVEVMKEEKDEMKKESRDRSSKLSKLTKRYQETIDLMCHIRADLTSIEAKLSNSEIDPVKDTEIILSKLAQIRQTLENAEDDNFAVSLKESKRKATSSKTLRKLTSKLALKHEFNDDDFSEIVPSKRIRKAVKRQGFHDTLNVVKMEEPEVEQPETQSPARLRPWENVNISSKKTRTIALDEQMDETNENHPSTAGSQLELSDLNRTYTIEPEETKVEPETKSKSEKPDPGLSRNGLVAMNRRKLKMPKI